MVVKDDGTKWACQSCLKGHRVSGCTHIDRELTLVPKKGRPVTQCHHCRLERKKRSAHVRCDCGEVEKPHHSKEKCIHLREAEERAKNGVHDEQHLQRDPLHLAAVAEEQGCCCHHGGHCSCAMTKKESADDLTRGPAVPKPRLETTRSEGHLTSVFAHGHHKHVHRKNHAAHEFGTPYKMHMPRAHTDNSVVTAARRSVDSLVLANDRVDMLPFTTDVSNSYDPQRSSSHSEHISPKHGSGDGRCRGGLFDDNLASIEFNDLATSVQRDSVGSIHTEINSFPLLEPTSATADSAFDPWSSFPSAESTMPNNNPFGAWPTLPEHSMFGQPALTAASSGTQSEIDEIPPIEDFYAGFMPSIQEDDGNDAAVNGSAANSRHSLPPGFFGNAAFNMPSMDEDLHMSLVSNADESTKPRSMSGDGVYGFDEVWTNNTMVNMPSAGCANGSALVNRPASHSIGPDNAPSGDIMKQLFPFDAVEVSAVNVDTPTAWRRFAALPDTAASNETSMAYTSGFDDEAGIMPTTWVDESNELTNSTYNGTFNMEQDYATPDFSESWIQ